MNNRQFKNLIKSVRQAGEYRHISECETDALRIFHKRYIDNDPEIEEMLRNERRSLKLKMIFTKPFFTFLDLFGKIRWK